jgi:hypothetical protein
MLVADYGQVTLIKPNQIEGLGVAAEETRPLAMARRLADELQSAAEVARPARPAIDMARKLFSTFGK